MSEICKNCKIEYQLITNWTTRNRFCPYCGKNITPLGEM
jgi:NADH pyrophosphatase NudC (nudix superfamily)